MEVWCEYKLSDIDPMEAYLVLVDKVQVRPWMLIVNVRIEIKLTHGVLQLTL